ncbi:hypothetical protein SAMN05216167_1116 [Spirosoma endophyticum]|uniref:Uncharacterized protein n=1 Tax=Spirosoma endophyticum TaxID=662367 RepID=A0A1I1YBN4_9BACT|nr:hypothetical protein SAMN05216167_1116 [Spirosoma endophyticum]
MAQVMIILPCNIAGRKEVLLTQKAMFLSWPGDFLANPSNQTNPILSTLFSNYKLTHPYGHTAVSGHYKKD